MNDSVFCQTERKRYLISTACFSIVSIRYLIIWYSPQGDFSGSQAHLSSLIPHPDHHDQNKIKQGHSQVAPFSVFWVISVLNDRCNQINVNKFHLSFSVFPCIMKSFLLLITFRRVVVEKGQVRTGSQTRIPVVPAAVPRWVPRQCKQCSCWVDS